MILQLQPFIATPCSTSFSLNNFISKFPRWWFCLDICWRRCQRDMFLGALSPDVCFYVLDSAEIYSIFPPLFHDERSSLLSLRPFLARFFFFILAFSPLSLHHGSNLAWWGVHDPLLWGSKENPSIWFSNGLGMEVLLTMIKGWCCRWWEGSSVNMAQWILEVLGSEFMWLSRSEQKMETWLRWVKLRRLV